MTEFQINLLEYLRDGGVIETSPNAPGWYKPNGAYVRSSLVEQCLRQGLVSIGEDGNGKWLAITVAGLTALQDDGDVTLTVDVDWRQEFKRHWARGGEG